MRIREADEERRERVAYPGARVVRDCDESDQENEPPTIDRGGKGQHQFAYSNIDLRTRERQRRRARHEHLVERAHESSFVELSRNPGDGEAVDDP